MHKQLHVLLALAMFRQGKDIIVSTPQLAKTLNISQQSASRILIRLEKEGLITRAAGRKGQHIALTHNGQLLLQQAYVQLQHALGLRQQRTITGKVISGFGEGKYYMAQQGYKRQFRQKLGYAPYEGTLNLRVSAEVGNSVYQDPTFFRIDGFAAKERNFGGLRCKRAMINGTIEGAVIIPDRTAHDATTIELIAPVQLRQKLRLKDGSLVTVVL